MNHIDLAFFSVNFPTFHFTLSLSPQKDNTDLQSSWRLGARYMKVDWTVESRSTFTQIISRIYDERDRTTQISYDELSLQSLSENILCTYVHTHSSILAELGGI